MSLFNQRNREWEPNWQQMGEQNPQLLNRCNIRNYSFSFPYTPLMQATYREEHDKMQVLIEQKSDVNIQSGNGNSALLIAASNNDDIAANLLIQNRANVNTKDRFGYTPLICSILQATDDRCMKVILEEKCNVNAQTIDFHISALSLCARRESLFLRLLLEKKAREIDFSLCDRYGHSVLSIACSSNRADNIILLLEYLI